MVEIHYIFDEYKWCLQELSYVGEKLGKIPPTACCSQDLREHYEKHRFLLSHIQKWQHSFENGGIVRGRAWAENGVIFRKTFLNFTKELRLFLAQYCVFMIALGGKFTSHNCASSITAKRVVHNLEDVFCSISSFHRNLEALEGAIPKNPKPTAKTVSLQPPPPSYFPPPGYPLYPYPPPPTTTTATKTVSVGLPPPYHPPHKVPCISIPTPPPPSHPPQILPRYPPDAALYNPQETLRELAIIASSIKEDQNESVTKSPSGGNVIPSSGLSGGATQNRKRVVVPKIVGQAHRSPDPWVECPDTCPPSPTVTDAPSIQRSPPASNDSPLKEALSLHPSSKPATSTSTSSPSTTVSVSATSSS